MYFADGEHSLKRVAGAPDSDIRDWIGVPVEVFGPRGWVATADASGLFNGNFERVSEDEALEWIARRPELTRSQLVEGFAAGAVSLDEVLAKIGGAVEARRLWPGDPDGDPSIGDLSTMTLYRELCAGRVSESDYEAICGALPKQ
ncbi:MULTISPECIES: hypothetical protein [Actinomycetes]|uniref:hypothetical protein n=1 Tax=Actinomycetes TaxID=1760 RepID=UPI0012DC27CB|nr:MULTISPECIES: hypothetical protein [Actinomycetes]